MSLEYFDGEDAHSSGQPDRRVGKVRTITGQGTSMPKAAFVILASGDSPESLGRVVNALMGVYEMVESGKEVKIIFDGAGTQAAAALFARITSIMTCLNWYKARSAAFAVIAQTHLGSRRRSSRLTCRSQMASTDIRVSKTSSKSNIKF